MTGSRFVTDYEIEFLSPPDMMKDVQGLTAAARRRAIFRFDPTQKRDPHGRWSVFGGIPLSAQDLHLSDGRVRLEARGNGLHIGLTDRGGQSNSSGALDPDSVTKLGAQMERAADREEWPEKRITQAVHTHDEAGEPATGYAQITYGGDGPIELELLDSDTSIKLEPAEARVLADDLNRIGAARRVDIESGPLDIFLPGGHRVGLRTTGLDGQTVETQLDGDDWRDMWHAADVLWEGFDESGDMFDPEQDIDHVTIPTESGPLEMRRIGEANDKASRIQIESPGKFTIEFHTDIRNPIWSAKEPVTEYGQAHGWIDE